MFPNVEPRPRHRDFVRVLLSDDHRYLEALFQDLVAASRRGDGAELRAEWTRFQRELTSHLDLEEHEILPAFGRAHLAEAQGLRDEHDAIRAALVELGVELDLHCLRTERVEAFIQLLRAHAHREEGTLYPWASRSGGGGS